MILKKLKSIFKSSWNTEHKKLWKISLELTNEGFSNFQTELNNKIKQLLNTNSIKFTENITDHTDLNDNSKKVKLIELSLNNFTESKLWIYHDMAEFDINKKHHIYEEWGYLKPEELQKIFVENICDILNVK